MFPNKLHGQVSSVSPVLQLWIILLISSSVYWFIAMNASSIRYFCIQIICLNGLIQEVMMSWMAYKWDIGDFDFNFCMMCNKSNFTVSQQTPWKCMFGILLQLILHPKSILSRSLCVQPLGISIDSKERKAGHATNFKCFLCNYPADFKFPMLCIDWSLWMLLPYWTCAFKLFSSNGLIQEITCMFRMLLYNIWWSEELRASA